LSISPSTAGSHFRTTRSQLFRSGRALFAGRRPGRACGHLRPFIRLAFVCLGCAGSPSTEPSILADYSSPRSGVANWVSPSVVFSVLRLSAANIVNPLAKAGCRTYDGLRSAWSPAIWPLFAMTCDPLPQSRHFQPLHATDLSSSASSASSPDRLVIGSRAPCRRTIGIHAEPRSSAPPPLPRIASGVFCAAYDRRVMGSPPRPRARISLRSPYGRAVLKPLTRASLRPLDRLHADQRGRRALIVGREFLRGSSAQRANRVKLIAWARLRRSRLRRPVRTAVGKPPPYESADRRGRRLTTIVAGRRIERALTRSTPIGHDPGDPKGRIPSTLPPARANPCSPPSTSARTSPPILAYLWTLPMFPLHWLGAIPGP